MLPGRQGFSKGIAGIHLGVQRACHQFGMVSAICFGWFSNSIRGNPETLDPIFRVSTVLLRARWK
jgi:hypothetical protein